MILYSRWLSLSLHTRNKIAEAFGIIKTGSTQVESNTIKHDGYDVRNIENALTKEAMMKFLDLSTTDNDMAYLFQMVVDRIENPPVVSPKVPLNVLPPTEAKQFKRQYKARTKKHAK